MSLRLPFINIIFATMLILQQVLYHIKALALLISDCCKCSRVWGGNQLDQPFPRRVQLSINLCSAGFSSQMHRAGGRAGGIFTPLLTREPSAVVRWAMRQTKALTSIFIVRKKYTFFKSSQVRSRSGQGLKSSIFAPRLPRRD